MENIFGKRIRWCVSMGLPVWLTLVGCGKGSGEGGQPVLLGKAENAKFSWVAANVLQPACVGCHSEGHAAAKVMLHTYAKTMEGLIVVPFKPEASSLYAQVASGKMPKKASKLSDEQVNAVYDWIRLGAQDN